MPNGNIMKVYQRYDETDPARTDTFFRQKREAVAYGKNFIKPSPVLEHDILTSKGGLIEALTTIPMRNVEHGEPELDFLGDDLAPANHSDHHGSPAVEFEAGEASALGDFMADEEPEIEF